MTTTGFAARARQLLDRGCERSERSQTEGHLNTATDSGLQCEKSEKGEKSPYPSLDAVIVASEAEPRPLDEIETRLARLVARAAEPDATPLDHHLVADWTLIRDAKLAGRHAA